MFGLLYTVYPNCTFISVNMYITACVLFPVGVFQGHLLREAETTHDSGY